MSKELVIDISKCTGCGYCELICSFAHHDEFNPRKSRVRVHVFLEKAMAVPVVCYQCEDPWCVKACPAGALRIETDAKLGTRMVTVDKSCCVGCKMCTLACPFGCVVVTDGTAEKCDLCGGTPQCVTVCRSKALQFIEAEAAVAVKKMNVAERLLNSYQEG